MLTLQLTSESQNRIDQFFEKMGEFPETIKDDAFNIVFDWYAQCVHHIFTWEGQDGDWAPLRPRTVTERSMMTEYGFRPAHPILHRMGYLEDSLTQLLGPITVMEPEPNGPGFEIRSGNQIDEFHLMDNRWEWHFYTLDERFETLDAKRPMLPDEGMWEQATQDAEHELFEMIERKAQF